MNRPHIPREDLARRYPRLLRAMQWAACLNSLEAESAIDMHCNYRSPYAGEAVNHYGGTLAVLRGAIRCRHAARRSYGRRIAA